MRRYSVIAADTLRDLVTLTFDLLTLVSGHTWRVTWSTTPPQSLKILRLSVIESRVLTGFLFDLLLHCRSRPKYDNSRHFDFEEVRGGVDTWWMARSKARAEFLLSVIELLFLSLTFEKLQGKTCQNSQPSAKISGVRGRPSKLHRATCRRFDTIPACEEGQTDRRTDGIAVTSIARAVKTKDVCS